MADEINTSVLLPIDIEAEMRKSYLDYAMSVIIARALPDVRDGLKPVQRRILVAMRYTEARLAKISEDILADLEKETVDFIPNFDQTREEPVVLPSRIPNLLVNGASGIAVGMATNIPPHNLREIVDAAILLIEKPDTTLKEVMKIVPGPDFPTGAYIAGREGIEAAYKTGRGSFTMRA